MTLDGGGWSLVWKHSPMEVARPLNHSMTYYSKSYKPCTDLEAGWCNVPNKTRLNPTEMMIAAYHNKKVSSYHSFLLHPSTKAVCMYCVYVHSVCIVHNIILTTLGPFDYKTLYSNCWSKQNVYFTSISLVNRLLGPSEQKATHACKH